MSELPSGWVEATVGDTGRYINGFAFKPEHWGNSGRPIIRIQNLTDPDKIPNRTDLQLPDDLLVRPGDLLVSWSATLDAFIWRGEEALLNQHIFRVVPDDRFVSRRYLYYLLKQLIAEMLKTEHLHGSTMKHINRGPFMAHPAPIAPRAEQERIADEIEKQFTRLDAATAALKRVQANLKRYRASVLKAACEGRLVPTEAELARREGREYETADKLLQRILRERRARWEADALAKMIASGKPPKDENWKRRYQEPSAPDDSFSFAVPEGWCIASMDQLTFRITSGSRDWSEYYGRGSGTFVMAQNVRPGRLDLSVKQPVDPPKDDSGVSRCRVTNGDLLVTIVGANTGDVCRVPEEVDAYYVCQSVALMRPVLPTLSSYLDFYMNSAEHGQLVYKRYTYGAGRPHLGFEQLKSTPVLLPPENEALRISTSIAEIFPRIERQERAVQAHVLHGSVLRTSILRSAFSGQLVPQDPNDEPAPALLERIRAGRTQDAQHKPTRSRREEPAYV